MKTGVQSVRKALKTLDSGFRRNDAKRNQIDFFTPSGRARVGVIYWITRNPEQNSSRRGKIPLDRISHSAIIHLIKLPVDHIPARSIIHLVVFHP